ncbi:MAG: hypothetical protein A2X84_09385 [Desulfuromonadaceae bacterium GWC2_58_13]|nr:MAG: hypothetical protein A2X84_09385 [Desulfuromonadaceae bacterium GWC2_58_13]
MVFRTLLFSVLFFSLSLLPAQASTHPDWVTKIPSRQQSHKSDLPSSTFSNLILTLATRPDVSYPAVSEALSPAARAAGKTILAELKKEYKISVLLAFVGSLQTAIDQFDSDYRATEAGAAGIDARAGITGELFQHLFAAAEGSGISPELLKMAYLKGCAVFERRLDDTSLPFADRELIDLLLLNALHQVEIRTYFVPLAKAFATINPAPVPNWPSVWQTLEEVETDHLAATLLTLEQVLADTPTLSDGYLLVEHQYNEEAMNDLLATRIGMTITFGGNAYDLQTLADRMDAIGGVMTGMAPETLLDSGIFTVLNGIDGSSFVLIPITDLAVYDWIRAEMVLNYKPVNFLNGQIVRAGGEVPAAPDLSVFAIPYLPIFQLEYDLDLCDEIYSLEMKALEDQNVAITQQPLTLQQRYALLRADARRRAVIVDRLKGVGDEVRTAIRILLSLTEIR